MAPSLGVEDEKNPTQDIGKRETRVNVYKFSGRVRSSNRGGWFRYVGSNFNVDLRVKKLSRRHQGERLFSIYSLFYSIDKNRINLAAIIINSDLSFLARLLDGASNN
jgi:hypothetical protein